MTSEPTGNGLPELPELPRPAPSTRNRWSGLLLLVCHGGFAALGCGSHAADGAASATPSASASAPATLASTDEPGRPYTIPPDGPPIVHKAGTVPSAVASAIAKDDAFGARAAVAPKIERLAAQPGKRKAPAQLESASMLDDGHLALQSPGRIEIVDLATFSSVALTTGARIFAMNGDATRLVTADVSNRIVLWKLGAKDETRLWAIPVDPDESDRPGKPDGAAPKADEDGRVAISADGSRVAYAGNATLRVWDAADGKELLNAPREVRSFEPVVTRDLIAVTYYNSGIDAVRLDDGKRAGGAGFQTGGTFGVVVSPDGRWAAGGAPDGHGLQVADMRVPGVRQLVESGDCDHHVNPWFSHDGRHVFASLGQDRVKGFEAETWKPYASYSATPGRVIAGMSDDLGRVLTTKDGLDPRVVVVSAQKETPLERALDASTSYTMSDDGLTVVGTDEKHEIRIWSTKTGKVVYEITPG